MYAVPCGKIAAEYPRRRGRREVGLEKNENVLAAGRKRRTELVQDNEKKIAAKSGRWKEGTEEEEEEEALVHAPLRSDCPSVRSSILDGPLGPKG